MNLFTRSAAGLVLIAGAANAQPPAEPTLPPPSDRPLPMADAPVDPRAEAPADRRFESRPDDVPPAPAARQQPRLLRWADGFLYSDGPATVFRQNGLPGRAANVIRGVGNGLGNSIIVDNGLGSNGVTVIENARNGFGNRIVIDGIELDTGNWIDPPAVSPWGVGRLFDNSRRAPVRRADPAPPVRTADPVYRGRDNPFWSKKVWSDTYDCNLYFCERSDRWYRYSRTGDEYRPIPSADSPMAPVRQ